MKVFVSSTLIDLEDHRKAVEEIINRLDQQFRGMEYFGSRPDEPKEVCFQEIDQCQVFIGIYAHRYGFIPEGDPRSIVEQELDYAFEKRIPCFCYIVDPNHPWPPEFVEIPAVDNMNALKRKVSNLVRSQFTTPDNLAKQVAADLGRFVASLTTRGVEPLVAIARQPHGLYVVAGIPVEEFGAFSKELARTSGQLSDKPQEQASVTRPVMPRTDFWPLQPAISAPRESLVQDLCKDLFETSWLAFIAGPGAGKTQLARSVALAPGARHPWWVSLRGESAETAHLHLEQQLVRWLVDLLGDDRLWHEYVNGVLDPVGSSEQVSAMVGGEGLLIVDDLRDPIEADRLYSLLHTIARVFSERGTKMLTTGYRNIPTGIVVDLAGWMTTVTPPLFNKSDIVEMLHSADFPPEMSIDEVSSLILGTTEGHPSLVAATVDWLRRNRWPLDGEAVEAIIRGEPVKEIRAHERRRMLHMLDDRPRQLLLRLSLLSEEFDRSWVAQLAAISPPLEYAVEYTEDLAGPYLDSLEGGRYQVTSLLRRSGEGQLPEEVQERVHQAVARRYLSQDTISVSQAPTIVQHLQQAGEYTELAQFLTAMMYRASTEFEARQVDWATHLFPPDEEWPADIGLEHRIPLRAVQVRARSLADGDVSELDADLKKLVEEAGPDEAQVVASAYVVTGCLLHTLPARVAFQRAIWAMNLFRNDPEFQTGRLAGRAEQLIWFPAVRLRGPEEVRELLTTVREMTDDERIRLFSSHFAMEAALQVTEGIWFDEAEKPAQDQDWDSVLRFLEEVKQVGGLPGATPLQVGAARASAVILADYLTRSEDALDLLEVVPDSTEPNLRFLMHYTAGCILFDDRNYRDSLHHLEEAGASPGMSFHYYRFDGKRKEAITDSQLCNWEEAKSKCIEAIAIASSNPDFYFYHRLEMLGELAWIHWSTGERKKACAALYGLVKELATGKDIANPRFREVFNKTGHALGWFWSVATTGLPPDVILTGEAYANVEAGLFGIRREGLTTWEPPLGFSTQHLIKIVAEIAKAVGLAKLAWAAYRLANNHRNGR